MRDFRTDLDPEGLLVSTDRHQDFQEELQRFHPDLRLAWDQERHFWVIVRRDLQVERLKLGEGEYLTYTRPIWTVIHEIKWTVMGPYKELVSHYREPSNAVLRRFLSWARAGEDDQFTFDNSATIQKHLRAHKETEGERQQKIRTDVEDLTHEALPFMDRTMVQVPEKNVR